MCTCLHLPAAPGPRRSSGSCSGSRLHGTRPAAVVAAATATAICHHNPRNSHGQYYYYCYYYYYDSHHNSTSHSSHWASSRRMLRHRRPLVPSRWARPASTGAVVSSPPRASTTAPTPAATFTLPATSPLPPPETPETPEKVATELDMPRSMELNMEIGMGTDQQAELDHGDAQNDHMELDSRDSNAYTTAHQQTSSPTSTPTAFHFFSQLPPELRLKVWNLSLPETRLVSIRCGGKSPSALEQSSSSVPPRPAGWTLGCTSDAAIPANLHACAESRIDALKSYHRFFGFARSPGHILFNPHTDILYFGPREGYMAAHSQFHTCMTMCDSAELARVRRVAVSDALSWIDQTYQSMTAASLTVEIIKQISLRMPNLRELLLVPRDEDVSVEPAMVHERIHQQIKAAICTVRKQDPDWIPPRWRIIALNTPPKAAG